MIRLNKRLFYGQIFFQCLSAFPAFDILQNVLSKLWQEDKSGKIMVECLTVLYDVIAINQTPVSPAAWSVLDLVEEDKIHDIVEGILNDSTTNDDSKVNNIYR